MFTSIYLVTDVKVRKRPLNKKELARKEDDIVSVDNNAYLTVHEPKLKVCIITVSIQCSPFLFYYYYF